MEAQDKISIGVLEDVVLLPWGVKIPARVDTGAALTSLDARDLTIKDDVAEFRLADKYGGTKISRARGAVAYLSAPQQEGNRRDPWW